MAQAKRKKKFFNVEIPMIRKDAHLQAYEVSDLNGRYVKYDLTRILKGKATLMNFKIIVEDENASTIPMGISLLPGFLKRVVRRGTNYVEDSFKTESKESEVQIKPFLVTRKKVSRAVRKALRNKAKEELIAWAKEKTNEELFDDVLKNKVQKDLSLKLKKIYPLSTCEIRILKVLEKTEL